MALGRGFASGFLMGMQGARTGLDVYNQAKQRQELEEIANAQTTELAPVADVTYAPIEDGTPAVGTVTDTAPKQFSLLGKTYDTAPTDAQINSARTMAMAGVLKKTNPLEGLRMEQQAAQGQRDTERYGREQKRWAQEDEALAKSKEYDEGRKSVFSGSRFGQNQQTYQKAMQDYQNQLSDYEAAKASGKTGAALGAAPVAPARPEYSVGDALADRAALIDHDAKYGKLDARAFGEFTDILNKVQSEGYEKTLRLAQSGGSLQEVAKSFNASGKVQLDPASVVSDKMVKGKDGVETRVIQFKDGQGNLRTINTVAELDSLGKAGDVFTRFYQGRQDTRAERADQRAGAAESRAATTFTEGQTEKKDKRAAGMAYYKEQNPNATAAELEAVRTGVVQPVPAAKDFKVEMSDVASALGTPAVDAQGKPITDLMTGRQVMNRNPDKEAAFFQWMRDNKITDTNKGLALYMGRSTVQSIATDPRAIAIRDDKNMTPEQKREKLKALGYK